jgi:molybdopterin converting factor small subunit
VVEIRYFAAIADLTGCQGESVDLPPGSTIGDLRALLCDRYGEKMDRMLKVAAYLVGDELTRDPAEPVAGRVDVLPPFAGG